MRGGLEIALRKKGLKLISLKTTTNLELKYYEDECVNVLSL